MEADDNPLVEAASAGNLELLRQLLAEEELPLYDRIANKLLAAASSKGDVNTLQFLLEKHAPSMIDEEPVRAAIYSRSIPMFAALHTHQPAIINMPFDHRGSPLIVACLSEQSLEFLTFLLEAGADPNQRWDEVHATSLGVAAAIYQEVEALELLIRYGAELEGSGALGSSAARNNIVTMRYLLDRGADYELDAGEGRACSALHTAAQKGNIEILMLLLESGVDANAKDSRGRTAIEAAERAERAEGVNLGRVKELLRRWQ